MLVGGERATQHKSSPNATGNFVAQSETFYASKTPNKRQNLFRVSELIQKSFWHAGLRSMDGHLWSNWQRRALKKIHVSKVSECER